ncbi:protein kinase [Streptomyces sp. NPDC058486]|uniref:protein kinase domain-containing protein n=1 Tax=unclassified Streptomyces TaxID=2593676 RepID=UPI003646266B
MFGHGCPRGGCLAVSGVVVCCLGGAGGWFGVGCGACPTGGVRVSGLPLVPEDPERVGGYWLAARLGAGGQGVVYEAYDAEGARVAVKVLHRDVEAFARDRFGREAEAARRVAPFCTARVLEAAVDGDVPYLVSEYIPGPTLAEAVRTGGPLDEDATWRLATGAATALAAIHSAGVVHRDLKPGNVLLGPDGPRIIDFGIARATDMSLTATGALMGTFGYMAPETLAGKRATPASDVFAWGAVVLYAATGTEPFRGANIAEVAHRTAAVDPDLSGVDPRLRPLLAAALAKDPVHRPDTHALLIRLVQAAAHDAVTDADTDAEPDADAVPAGSGLSLLRAGAEQAAGGGLPRTPTLAVAPLGERAEVAYEGLSAPAQGAAVELLLRLVVPGSAGDGSQDGVRTAARSELFDGRPDSEQRAMALAVEGLAAAGALVVDADGGTRPVSAALLPAWPRLRGWVDHRRGSVAQLQRLARATERWIAHGRRDDDLPTGSELRALLDWFATVPSDLRPNPAELQFLAAARKAAARAVRRRRRLLSGLAGATVLALLAGAVAYVQNREAEARQAEAERRQAEAQARTVAQTAHHLRGAEPDTAMLLGLAAYRIAPVPEALGALYGSLTQQTTETIPLPSVDDGGLRSGMFLTQSGTGLMAFSPVRTTFIDLTRPPTSPRAPRTVRVLSGRYDWSEGIPAPVSPDGALLLRRTGENRAQVVSTTTGRPVADSYLLPLDGLRDVTELSLTNTGHLVERSSDGTSRVRDPAGRAVSLPLGSVPDRGTSLVRGDISPTGLHALECDADGVDILRTAGSSEATRLFVPRSPDCHRTTVFSPDGSMVARMQNAPETSDVSHPVAYGEVRIWSTDIPATITLPDMGILEGRFSSGGRFFLGATSGGDIEIWTTATGTHVGTVASSAKEAKSLYEVDFALHEPTQSLLVMDRDNRVLRRTDISAVIGSAPDPQDSDTEVVTAAVSTDGSTAVVREGVTDMRQKIVDLRSGRVLHTVPQRWEEVATRYVSNALDHDGGVLAFTDYDSANRQHIVVWDTRRNREIHRFTPADDTVRRLTLSPDGRYASVYVLPGGVSEGMGGTVQVWDIRERKEVHRFPNVTSYGRFSPDGHLLVLTSGDVLDLRTRQVRTAAWGKAVTALAFSPDGELLALALDTGAVELWDGAARQRLAHLPGAAPRPRSGLVDTADEPVFSQDGKLLAAVTNGAARVQLWDVEARAALGEPLDAGGRDIDALAFGADGTLRVLQGAAAVPLSLLPESAAAAVCKRAGRDITPEEWRTYILTAPYRKLCQF